MRYKVRQKTARRKIFDTYTAITIPDGRIHSFNKTATFIFEQIESGADSGDIPALLTGEYDVPPETAAADTKELIEKLLELNIIEKNA